MYNLCNLWKRGGRGTLCTFVSVDQKMKHGAFIKMSLKLEKRNHLTLNGFTSVIPLDNDSPLRININTRNEKLNFEPFTLNSTPISLKSSVFICWCRYYTRRSTETTAHRFGGNIVKIHIHSFNRISSPSVQELLHSLFYSLSYKKTQNRKQSHKEIKRITKTAYLKITTIIQYIIILLDIFFT